MLARAGTTGSLLMAQRREGEEKRERRADADYRRNRWHAAHDSLEHVVAHACCARRRVVVLCFGVLREREALNVVLSWH